MGVLNEDLKGALRLARRRPGFAVAVLASLAIGTGSAAAVFSLVDAALIRPLPYPAPERIAGVWFTSPNLPGGLSRVRQSAATFLHIRDRTEAWESFALAERTAVTVDEEREPARIPAAAVTPEIFPVLRVAPALGRGFRPSENLPGADPTVLLSDRFWSARYGRNPAAVGQYLTVDGLSHEIIGILPPSVRFPDDETQLWIPLTIDPGNVVGGDFIYTGYGRLKPGMTLAAAEQDFLRLVDLLPEAYPSIFPRALIQRLKLGPLVVPLLEEQVGGVRQTLLIALSAVLVVLLVVIANVAHLFVVRNSGMARDLAVRAAVGATPTGQVRALVVEGLLYGLVGGLLGLLLGSGLLALLTRLGPGVIPRLNEVVVGGRIVLVVLALSLLVGLLVGLLPAWRLGRQELAPALRAGGRMLGSDRATHRFRRLLVGAQFALALALLVNAGLLVRSLRALNAVTPGFESGGLLGARIFLPARDYPGFPEVNTMVRNLVDGAGTLSGVSSAAAVSFLPLRDGRIFYGYLPENAASEDLAAPRLTKVVTDGYFETMGIPLQRGRSFTRDDLENNTESAVVSEAFAAALWPGQDPVGRRFRTPALAGSPAGPWLTVVGVVQSVRDRDLTQPGAEIVYLPFRAEYATHSRWREVSLVVRSTTTGTLAGPLRQLVARFDRRVPVFDIRTMNEVLADTTARTRYTMLLVIVAACAALVIAAVGLYGLLAQLVNDRRREMGLRLALGATPASVRRMIQRQALLLVALGGSFGLLLTLGTNRVLASVLFGVPLADPFTFISVVLVLTTVGWVAASVPAWRAARTAPAVTLREE